MAAKLTIAALSSGTSVNNIFIFNIKLVPAPVSTRRLAAAGADSADTEGLGVTFTVRILTADASSAASVKSTLAEESFPSLMVATMAGPEIASQLKGFAPPSTLAATISTNQMKTAATTATTATYVTTEGEKGNTGGASGGGVGVGAIVGILLCVAFVGALSVYALLLYKRRDRAAGSKDNLPQSPKEEMHVNPGNVNEPSADVTKVPELTDDTAEVV